MAGTVRFGTVSDVPTLVEHRLQMFRDMGMGDETSLAEMGRRFTPWVRDRLEDASYRSWLVELDGQIVASADVWLRPRQPGIGGLHDVVPYVLNVYTAPEARRLGLARRLMGLILEWASAEGHGTVELHASDDGRPLYESLGFTPTNEMRLRRQVP